MSSSPPSTLLQEKHHCLKLTSKVNYSTMKHSLPTRSPILPQSHSPLLYIPINQPTKTAYQGSMDQDSMDHLNTIACPNTTAHLSLLPYHLTTDLHTVYHNIKPHLHLSTQHGLPVKSVVNPITKHWIVITAWITPFKVDTPHLN